MIIAFPSRSSGVIGCINPMSNVIGFALRILILAETEMVIRRYLHAALNGRTARGPPFHSFLVPSWLSATAMVKLIIKSDNIMGYASPLHFSPQHRSLILASLFELLYPIAL